jgi:hypothetical protein
MSRDPLAGVNEASDDRDHENGRSPAGPEVARPADAAAMRDK